MFSFFERLTIEQRLLVINGVLVLVVAIVAVLLMTGERTVPAEPPMDDIAVFIENVKDTTVVEQGLEGDAGLVGSQPIFDTIIPLPTPSPTPVPTPVPDPSLEQAIESWKVNIVSLDMVSVTDLRTQKEITLWTDPEYGATEEIVRFQNQDMTITIDDLDDMEFTATFLYSGPQGEQRVTKSMFDE